jgi:hypothetical protein
MDARAKTVRDILHSGDQYLIPFFQRHYSWKLRHWQRLWDDVRTLLDDRNRPRLHFMGPLVCTPISPMPGEVPQFQLIDGQQRLTTLTVMLAVLRDIARAKGLTELAEDITERYLVQKREKGVKRYKMVPRVGDREVLFAVIDGKATDHSRRDGIVRAHRYFTAVVDQYACADDLEQRLRALVTAVTSQLSLVVVTIEGENPYEIFESLNSTGLPLEESDLVRNFIFMKVPLVEQEEFHRAHWQPFEAMFEANDDTDAGDMTGFYRNYLMRDGVYSRKKATFVDFKEQMRASKVAPATLVEELRRYARFDLILRHQGHAPDAMLDAAIDDLDMLDVATANPLLMHLMARNAGGELSVDELVGCIADLQSFVLRRSICGESTRGYNEMFPAAIKSIGQAPREDLRRYWIARGWPDDGTFRVKLLDFAIYRREPTKAELILRRLEQSFGHKEGPDLEELTIEHVLPQSIASGKFGTEWQEALGERWQHDHEAWLHTLGNLTLTGYNPKLSNRSFPKKKELFAKSNVQLNAYFATLRRWDSDAIRRRGEALAKLVAEAWPAPADARYIPGKPESDVQVMVANRAELKAVREQYWEEFQRVLNVVAPEIVPRNGPGDRPWMTFSAGRTGCWYGVVVDAEEACISAELCLRGRNARRGLALLRQDEPAIETELGRQVDWDFEGSPVKASLFLDSAHIAERSDWPRQHRWLAESLERLMRVTAKRILSSKEPVVNARKTFVKFWSAFDNYPGRSFSSLQFPPPKPEGYRDVGIGDGVFLRVEVYPPENYIWAGLGFEGSAPAELLSRATAGREMLKTRPDELILVEESDDVSWLGAYRLAYITEESRWPEYFDWLQQIATRARSLYLEHLKGVPTT